MACGQPQDLAHGQDDVEDIMKILNEKFGELSPLTVTRGKVLKYLGLTLYYRTKFRVKLSIFSYIKK